MLPLEFMLSEAEASNTCTAGNTIQLFLNHGGTENTERHRELKSSPRTPLRPPLLCGSKNLIFLSRKK